MDQRRALGATHLKRLLIWVLDMHGYASVNARHSSDVRFVVQTEGHPDVPVHITSHAIAELAENLRIATPLIQSSDIGAFAQRMADVATVVSDFDILIADSRNALGQINPLAHKIRTEFSIVCVVALAESYGYDIPISSLPHEQLSLVFLMRDWTRLAKIFADSLEMTSQRPAKRRHYEEGHEGPEALIRHFEMQFADASPIPGPGDIGGNKQLSAESYWNLRSVAEQEHWSLADVVALIELHLSPTQSANIAFHSSTISGLDWRRLYDWLHREGGHML